MSIIHTLNDLVLSGEFWLLTDGCVSKDAAAKLELEQIQESLLIDSFPLFQRLPPTYVPVSFCENSVFQLEEAHKARPDSTEEQRCSRLIVWMQKRPVNLKSSVRYLWVHEISGLSGSGLLGSKERSTCCGILRNVQLVQWWKSSQIIFKIFHLKVCSALKHGLCYALFSFLQSVTELFILPSPLPWKRKQSKLFPKYWQYLFWIFIFCFL